MDIFVLRFKDTFCFPNGHAGKKIFVEKPARKSPELV